jgi:hypothetical protein
MNFLKSIEIPFEMFSSNYTVEFAAEGLSKKYVHSMQSNRAFACFAKLKSDLKNKPVPEIDMREIRYFIHDFKSNESIGDVINIDLKSAYATVLFRDGYISEHTYNYICKGTKQERLTSVGMLASKKQHFKFSGGKIICDPVEIVSPISNFFFYCVKRTGEIMEELKSIAGNDYLFTWVDGIYMRPNIPVMEECEKYIESIGHRYSTEWLRDFTVSVKPKFVNVHFLKMSKGEWKPKPFNLPHADSEFKKLMVEAILTRKKDPNNFIKPTK